MSFFFFFFYTYMYRTVRSTFLHVSRFFLSTESRLHYIRLYTCIGLSTVYMHTAGKLPYRCASVCPIKT